MKRLRDVAPGCSSLDVRNGDLVNVESGGDRALGFACRQGRSDRPYIVGGEFRARVSHSSLGCLVSNRVGHVLRSCTPGQMSDVETGAVVARPVPRFHPIGAGTDSGLKGQLVRADIPSVQGEATVAVSAQLERPDDALVGVAVHVGEEEVAGRILRALAERQRVTVFPPTQIVELAEPVAVEPAGAAVDGAFRLGHERDDNSSRG